MGFFFIITLFVSLIWLISNSTVGYFVETLNSEIEIVISEKKLRISNALSETVTPFEEFNDIVSLKAVAGTFHLFGADRSSPFDVRYVRLSVEAEYDTMPNYVLAYPLWFGRLFEITDVKVIRNQLNDCFRKLAVYADMG